MTSLNPDIGSLISLAVLIALDSAPATSSTSSGQTIVPPDGYDELWLMGYSISRTRAQASDSDNADWSMTWGFAHQTSGSTYEALSTSNIVSSREGFNITGTTNSFEVYRIQNQVDTRVHTTNEIYQPFPEHPLPCVFFQQPLHLQFSSSTGASQTSDWLTLIISRYTSTNVSWPSVSASNNVITLYFSDTDPNPPPPPFVFDPSRANYNFRSNKITYR